MALIEVKNLYSGYGKLKVLFDINMKVEEKKITVVVGPNGAGKTTLLNSITGIATIHGGKVFFENKDITGMPPHKVAKLGIAYLPQMGNVFAGLTVYENLRMAGKLLDKSEIKDRIDEMMEMFPVLKEFAHRKAGTLSGGERRMLAIAMALMRRPKILLLDEITTDLAPILVKRVLKRVVELKDELDLTIVLVEQRAKRALEIGDYAYLLVSGTLRFSGKAQELLEHPELSRLYLGIK
ncbi:MAG: ABC transporter ATP-binding protein [Candidatus Methanomethylicota archaeon]|uniref:ABC transporter ATP-binding protein n=1 Tax=Thermoproteota archaeon TaxID=2056631 RepID=A0A497ESD4_9CREN|nr:MAG: ABC transporter ATP-binding protein [Candidatus Verstraetearchaeota archaeon]